MGSLLVLVSPCFRENVIVTCKIVFFCFVLFVVVVVVVVLCVCSLDNFLLEKNNCFLFWKSNFKVALI